MPPVPKKKHTKSRSGKRKNAPANRQTFAKLSKCPSCGKLKYPHRACPHCGFYDILTARKSGVSFSKKG
ncbi:50S ribosomal protein L32 [Candidatus Woesebacteria bacterium RIFCSPHIGHO2_01_FULL_37_10]|uniref:Large ribosomal subunit protein bL32 n=1 Tax=Candidatus Woesebacteria bacterium RIFCSPHIGHO2_01_FULL_37_10 TaxID=1802489 RepID=A0A1F7XWR0_9BACT|nr:MAG: 50S ribosomal protein L32 [Candidatus Woesebacteria bacterium RIFCSPHIGHO2_01_FULL_37_10]